VNESVKGQILFEGQRTIDAGKLDELTTALDTESAAQTATLVPFFAPTIPGEALFVERLEIDYQRALLGGISYQWSRPFREGEVIDIRFSVEDIYKKGNLTFAIVTAEFDDAAGETVQIQKATFIERVEP
jgi:hypothetical protein